MDDRKTVEAGQGAPVPDEGRRAAVRLGDESAARILERAAALDAERNAEIGVDQLREAAAGAGISRDAFEQAMREYSADGGEAEGRSRGSGRTSRPTAELAVGGADLAYYSGLLRDLLGDEGRVTVTDDRIEWRDDEGIFVSLNPSTRAATTCVTVEGRLRTRMLGVLLGALLPILIFFIGVFDADEWGFLLTGALVALAASLVGTWFSFARERRSLRKRAERIRRQLDRLLGPAP